MTKEEYKRRQIEAARMFADFHKSSKLQRMYTTILFAIGASLEIVISCLVHSEEKLPYLILGLGLIGTAVFFWKLWTKDMNRWLELRQECLDKANRQ